MAVRRAKEKKSFAQRAQRFVIELPIRYRELGTVDWRVGKTVNISMSGVLFRSAQSLQPKTQVEIALTLPVAISGECPAELGCRGTVVRQVSIEEPNGSLVLAASILRYRFAHRRHNGANDNSESAAK
ncbi:MAG: PilZ domain-containing protein [Terriglobia bacterium]